jgi:hypothetical protein
MDLFNLVLNRKCPLFLSSLGCEVHTFDCNVEQDTKQVAIITFTFRQVCIDSPIYGKDIHTRVTAQV